MLIVGHQSTASFCLSHTYVNSVFYLSPQQKICSESYPFSNLKKKKKKKVGYSLVYFMPAQLIQLSQAAYHLHLFNFYLLVKFRQLPQCSCYFDLYSNHANWERWTYLSFSLGGDKPVFCSSHVLMNLFISIFYLENEENQDAC